MTELTLGYRADSSLQPRFLKNSEVEAVAQQARKQLLPGDADAMPMEVLRSITRLQVNGLGYDLWVDTENPVADENGSPVFGICEFDIGAGIDHAAVSVSPVGGDMTEELVLSTLGHELGHAVFDVPGWIRAAAAGPGLFGTATAGAHAYRSTTRDVAHLGSNAAHGSLASSNDRDRQQALRFSEFRANEFMGSLLVPRDRVIQAVIELAPKYEVKLEYTGLADGALAGQPTVRAENVVGFVDMENLQKAIGKRFGVHGRFIRVRMQRYGLLGSDIPH